MQVSKHNRTSAIFFVCRDKPLVTFSRDKINLRLIFLKNAYVRTPYFRQNEMESSDPIEGGGEGRGWGRVGGGWGGVN